MIALSIGAVSFLDTCRFRRHVAAVARQVARSVPRLILMVIKDLTARPWWAGLALAAKATGWVGNICRVPGDHYETLTALAVNGFRR